MAYKHYKKHLTSHLQGTLSRHYVIAAAVWIYATSY